MKHIIKKAKNYLIDIGALKWVSDETYIKYLYKKIFNEELKLKNPEMFTEKLQWLKLYYRNPQQIKMVDKYEAKKYVKDNLKINEIHTIPTLGVFTRFKDINFDVLPNKFVIKCTHDSGSVTVVKDKKKMNYKKLKRYFDLKMKVNFYNRYREWPYKNVKPKIMIEELMEDNKSDVLTDYKFFCFNGEPKVMYISKDNSNDPRTDFFDMNFKHLDLHLKDPNADVIPLKPDQFEQMKKYATVLAKQFPFIRIDFYIINNKIYFGEFTFYHLGGFFHFHPESWNKKFGDLIDLSKIK